MSELTKSIQEKEININLKSKILELKNEVNKLHNLINSLNINKDKEIEKHNLKKKSLNENFDYFDFNVFSTIISENYKVSPRENMFNIFSISEKFVLDFDKDNGDNLLFFGAPGTGKSFMSNCILNDLIKNGEYIVRSYSAVELFDIVQDSLINKTKYNRLDYDMLFEYDLLVIDNLGTELNNYFNHSNLLNIIESRELNYKKTIITTNLTPKQIGSLYTQRILSRILGNYRPLKFIGPDIRWEIFNEVNLY